jgi:acyl-CoA hydrolase
MVQDAKAIYEERQVTSQEAVKAIRSGQRILVGNGCSAPQELLRALVARAPELADVELVHLMTFGIAPYVDVKYEGSFRHNAFFIGSNVRDAIAEGRSDYTPVFLSEIPDLFLSHQMRLDVALITVTPPDRFGYCSLGIHPDIMKAGVEAAKMVIAQVNSEMPWTHGDTFVHVSEIDRFVLFDEPILELPFRPFGETSIAIARHVASLIENGSTLQLGIGNIPNAILSLLGNHRDLGIHSEMVSDGVIDLCEGGVITNRRKGLHQGKAVTSFAMGTRRLYDFVDDNPFWEFHQTAYVNSPRIIAQNHRMVSINSALQVDITGQISADSIGTLFFSGIGGQVDFIRGAAMCPEGKPIIALPATAKGGAVSRIAPKLDEGAGVVTSRGDVHYVVTEYGVAYLHGKTIRERAMALIEIAHPDFRPELRDYAVSKHYVPVVWELPTEARRYPSEMEEYHDFKGKRLFVRPLRSADADRLMEFFYSHSPETIYGRYRFPKKSLPRKEAIRLCTLDYARHFALAVFGEEGKEEHLAAVGRYILNERTQFAETALVIHENYRRLGIASYLLRRLRQHAESTGILGFYGESSPSNTATIALHRAMGHPVVFDPEAGVYRYSLRFAEHPPMPEPRSSAKAT